MKRLVLPLCWMISCWLMLACEHKDLCYDHNHSPMYFYQLKFDFVRDWERKWEGGTDWKTAWPDSFGITYDSIRPGLPEGVRARVYRKGGQEHIYNYPIGGGWLGIGLPEDFSLIFHNNDTEFIEFSGLESFIYARATTRSVHRSTYSGNTVLASRGGTNKEEITVNPPDMLYGSYIEKLNPKDMQKDSVLNVVMHPLVFTYLIRFEIDSGLENVKQTRGALAGMASSVYLNSGKTSRDRVTVLYDCELTKFGAQSLVTSFGIPDFPNPDYTRGNEDFRYGVTLEVTLKNNKYKNFHFDVTDQVQKQPHGGVIFVKGIEIPSSGGSSSGGFGASVDEWTSVDVPLEL